MYCSGGFAFLVRVPKAAPWVCRWERGCSFQDLTLRFDGRIMGAGPEGEKEEVYGM